MAAAIDTFSCSLFYVDLYTWCFAHKAAVSKMFDPPEGQKPFSYVFDLTGEVRHDRPDLVRHSYLVLT